MRKLTITRLWLFFSSNHLGEIGLEAQENGRSIYRSNTARAVGY